MMVCPLHNNLLMMIFHKLIDSVYEGKWIGSITTMITMIIIITISTCDMLNVVIVSKWYSTAYSL